MVRRGLTALLVGLTATPLCHGAPRAVIADVQKVERADPPYESSPLQDERVFNCESFKLTEHDVRFALRHARPVSERRFLDELVSVGCFANFNVTLTGRGRWFFAIEPTGRIFASAAESSKGGARRYYHCRPCEAKPPPWGPDVHERLPPK